MLPLMASEGDLHVVLLGHSSLAVTQEYLQFRDADIMDAYNSVDFGSM